MEISEMNNQELREQLLESFDNLPLIDKRVICEQFVEKVERLTVIKNSISS